VVEPIPFPTARGTPSEEGTRESPLDRAAEELAELVSHNLKRLRQSRGHSLERLAKLAGVSRAMLSRIEAGRSVPTIALLWKVARARRAVLGPDHPGPGSGTVVLRARSAKILSSTDGSFTSQALFPFESERQVEFYRLTLAGRAQERAAGHAAGTTENRTAVAGEVEIEPDGADSIRSAPSRRRRPPASPSCRAGRSC